MYHSPFFSVCPYLLLSERFFSFIFARLMLITMIDGEIRQAVLVGVQSNWLGGDTCLI